MVLNQTLLELRRTLNQEADRNANCKPNRSVSAPFLLYKSNFSEDAKKRLEAKIQSGNFEMVRRYHICSLRRKNETPFHEIIGTFLFFFAFRPLGRNNSREYFRFRPISQNRKYFREVEKSSEIFKSILT